MSELARRLLASSGGRSVSEDEVQFGVNPIDELRRTVNTRSFTPEQAAENRQKSLWEALSVIPGPGNVISAKDAYNSAGDASNAYQAGDYKGAAIHGGLSGVSALGAVLGLPFGKHMKRAADAGADSLYAIPAWHGSPHDFDEFKLDKIGTGEGAQAYGHGLYFAGNRNVAREYEGALAKSGNDPAIMAREALHRSGGDHQKALDFLRQEQSGLDHVAAMMQHSGDPTFGWSADSGREAMRLVERNMQGEALPLAGKGRLYRTELDVEPEDLLDWDKPLSEQSSKVREAIGKLPEGRALFEQEAAVRQIEGRLAELKNQRMTPEVSAEGSELSRRLLQERQRLQQLEARFEDYKTLTGSPAGTQALREAGIPGIRYLDQGSRGAGQGSSNYVIFDDSLVKILGKE